MTRRRGRASWLLVALLAAAALLPSSTAYSSPLDEDSTIELGGQLGVITGGNTSAGGLQLSGNFLYRLSRIDWFEGGMGVVIGNGRASCFTDRAGEARCNHGPIDGRIGELSGGIRRYLMPQQEFTPYVHLRLGLRLVTFPGDNARGLAIPVTAGVGVRGRVNEFISVGGSASLEAGVGFFNRNLGVEPQLDLAINVGVEFTLD